MALKCFEIAQKIILKADRVKEN